MKRATRLLGVLAALLSLTPFVRPQRTSHAFLLWPFKMVAGGLSALLALEGAIVALLGLVRRDLVVLAGGLTAALAAGRYVALVTRSHQGFARAFGPDWAARLSPEVSHRLLPRRWTPLAIPPRARRHKNLIFGRNPETGQTLRADVWQPASRVPQTGLAVVYVHGGGWRIGNKDMGTRPLFRHLAGQGHVIMDIDYALSPRASMAAMVQDVKRAVLWLKRHGATYGVDPERLVVMGGSAGGHLALLAAYTPNHPALQPEDDDGDTSLRAVVAFYPPTDLLSSYGYGEAIRGQLLSRRRRSLADELAQVMLGVIGLVPRGSKPGAIQNVLASVVGATPAEQPELYRLLSPSQHVNGSCPPTLLLQGDDDVFGMSRDVDRLHQALCRAGAISVLVRFPHTDHAFDLPFPEISPVAQAAIYDVERFLALMASESGGSAGEDKRAASPAAAMPDATPAL